MTRVVINGIELNYAQMGRGEDLVLIHGLAANQAFWNLHLLLPLARRYRVTTFDLRGHGYSEMPPSAYTSADMASDLLGLLDHLGIERAHLVGHSLGGAVALHCAAVAPERVTSLVVLDSRIRALQPTMRMRDWPDWQQAKEALEGARISIDEDADDVGVELLSRFAATDGSTGGLKTRSDLFVPFGSWSKGDRSAARWLELERSTTMRADIRELAGLTRAALQSIRQPTLAVYGSRSRCLASCQQLPTVLSNCVVHIVDDAGHFFPVVKPGIVADMILRFLPSATAGEASLDPGVGSEQAG